MDQRDKKTFYLILKTEALGLTISFLYTMDTQVTTTYAQFFFYSRNIGKVTPKSN